MKNYVADAQPILSWRFWTYVLTILTFLSSCTQEAAKEAAPPKPSLPFRPDKLVVEDAPNPKPDSSIASASKKLDTTATFYFKDLSTTYNYKVVDRCMGSSYHGFCDSVTRVIKVLDKNDSLIQKIYPTLSVAPREFYDNGYPPVKYSRSYITGKNANAFVYDDYYGEIVVADLNFDGLEDFGTPVDHGTDNGPHYAFYIQDHPNHFKFNAYLTERVVWFPSIFRDSLKSFTTTLASPPNNQVYLTFQYDTIEHQWRQISGYSIDLGTGKRRRLYW